MTDQNQELNQAPVQTDKEINFQKQRQMYEAQLAKERAEKEQLMSQLQERQKVSSSLDDEDDGEPYVDHKKLNKKLSAFEKSLEEKIEQKAEMKARMLLEQEKQQTYLQSNPDFNHIMSSDTVQQFADQYPRLAENILRMPDSFDRQRLVYETIKSLQLDKPKAKEPSIQEKIDANRRSPYYQPSNVGNAPYQSMGDFSDQGQKNNYQKMQELKNRMRLG